MSSDIPLAEGGFPSLTDGAGRPEATGPKRLSFRQRWMVSPILRARHFRKCLARLLGRRQPVIRPQNDPDVHPGLRCGCFHDGCQG